MDPHRTAARRRSPLARAFADRQGDLRTPVLAGAVVGVAVLLTLGMFIALLAAGAGSPGVLAAWVTAAFIFIKLPLLGVVWWILIRRRDAEGGGGWTSRECREILDYLEAQAREAVGRPDAAARLAYFAREAWHVADTAADTDTPAAVDTAVLIEGMAAEAGAPVERPAGRGAPRPAGPEPAA
ncbi:hypothetical protein [Miltoncostaea marina]|uniref:hypothetical protein n=1 Tax=Miltoncostaea marina TaxID=2843215 RepID=UPI001C3D0BFA|nr:hypothetical protein [Miltoncostaea marina]